MFESIYREQARTAMIFVMCERGRSGIDVGAALVECLCWTTSVLNVVGVRTRFEGSSGWDAILYRQHVVRQRGWAPLVLQGLLAVRVPVY